MYLQSNKQCVSNAREELWLGPQQHTICLKQVSRKAHRTRWTDNGYHPLTSARPQSGWEAPRQGTCRGVTRPAHGSKLTRLSFRSNGRRISSVNRARARAKWRALIRAPSKERGSKSRQVNWQGARSTSEMHSSLRPCYDSFFPSPNQAAGCLRTSRHHFFSATSGGRAL